MRPGHLVRCAMLLLGLAAGLAAWACGGGSGAGLDRDTARTPAYADFLQRLGEQRTPVRFLGAHTVQGHWSTADSVAASGCQCATTWAALYVEHRLSLDGHVVLVDEELIPGGSGLDDATALPPGVRHLYRRQNLVATTATSDGKTLVLLQQLFDSGALRAHSAERNG